MSNRRDHDAPTSSTNDSTGAPWHWWSAVALVVAIVATFLAVAALGAHEAARDERVLSLLDPLIALERVWGWQTVLWLLAKGNAVAWTITAMAAAIALAGLVAGRRRAAPLALLAAAISSASWGQILLFADQVQLGALLYGCGITCAVLLGIWCPLSRLEGFPPLALPGDRARMANARQPRRLPWAWECVLIWFLTLAGLLTRTYALTELPQGFELEMIDSIISSRTLYGLDAYVRGGGFLSNSTGLIHLLPKVVLFKLFGTSVYSLRLSAVIFGVAAIPLMYGLIRRMAGVGPAIAATVLLIAAPEQLYWSRLENANFAPVAVLGLVTAHLGLWMVERCSVWAVLAAALWMPFCRYFYAPAYIAFAYPLILYPHALIFVRGAWRKAWYVVPVLAGGLALWIFSLSLLYTYLNDWHWRFVHPAFIFGAPAWRMHGQSGFRDAGVLELVGLQSAAMASKLGEVVASLVYHGPRVLSWFFRMCALPNHITVTNAGVAVMFALGLGYLLGQLYERRAFLLLLWVGLGVLPALLSDEAGTRRLALMFPAIYATAGVLLGAAVRMVRAGCGRWLAGITAAILSVAVAASAWTSMASHFLVPTGPVFVAPLFRFARPLFKSSDVILHNLDPAIAKAILLDNLDGFLDAPSCYHHVDDGAWLQAAVHLPCDFNGSVYQLTMPPARREALQRAYDPRRITFLFQKTPYSRRNIALLQRLYPAAEVQRTRFAGGERTVVSLTVDIAMVRALRSLSLWADTRHEDHQALQNRLLADVTLSYSESTADDATANQGIIVRGGLLLDREGWYRLQVTPDCAEATLTLDQQPASVSEARAMLAGVHAFELRLPSATACRLPLHVLMQSSERTTPAPVDPSDFVSPVVASAPEAQAPRVFPYAGYGEAKVLAQLRGGAMGLGVDARGRAHVLVLEEGNWSVQRFDPNGNEEARWVPQLPPGHSVTGMVVDPDGTTILMAETIAGVYDQAGNRIGTWKTPWDAGSTNIALWPDGRVLLAIPSRDAIAVFTRDGTLHGEIKQFDGEPGRFHQPASVTVSAAGDMLVIQDDGRALLFRSSGDPLKPVFETSFLVALSSLPAYARGGAFDGPNQFLVSDPSVITPLVYNSNGERLMASVPSRDFGTKGIGYVAQFQATTDRLYAIDRSGNRLWAIER